MEIVSQAALSLYQKQIFRTGAGLKLTSPQQAISYVNERGFIFFWPVKSFRFPSLWTAAAGDRPVPDAHDDPGHITWSWKDSLLDQRVWYYARLLKHKNSIVSLETIPYFYALSPNYGDPEADFLDQYEQGQLPLEAKLIFETLLKHGPLDTISLRKESHLSGPNSQSPFNRALDLLQQQLKVLPVSVSEAGAWNYAFVYDLTHRYYPQLQIKAREITENQAMDHLLTQFFASLGAATLKHAATLFNWLPELTQRSLNRLVKMGTIVDNVGLEKQPGEYYCIKKILA